MSEYVYERIDTCTVCGRNEIGMGPTNPTRANEFRTYRCNHDGPRGEPEQVSDYVSMEDLFYGVE